MKIQVIITVVWNNLFIGLWSSDLLVARA